MYYIDVDTFLKVIDNCPDVEWQLVVALARFGGLRIPSEINNLKWSHIDWQENRMTVDNPKNAKKRGCSYRIVPLFKELRPYLERAFEAAPAGSVYCIVNRTKTSAHSLVEYSVVQVSSSGRNCLSIYDPTERLN